MKKESKLSFEDCSYDIINAIFEVHRKIGPGLPEKGYQNGLCYVLNKKGLKIESEKIYPVMIDDYKVCEYRADIVVEDQIIVEVKSVPCLLSTHQAQLINYLKISGIPIGLLVNFQNESVRFRRLTNYK